MNHKISIYYDAWKVVIHLLLALIVQCWYMFSFVPKVCTDIMLHFWVFRCQGTCIVQYVNAYTKASKGVPGDYQIVSCKTIIQLAVSHADHGSILIDSNFYFKLEWLELAAGAPLDSCMLQAIREDCLNHKPFSISASSFFLSFLLEFLLFLALTPNLLVGSQSMTIFHFVFNHSQPTFTYRGIAQEMFSGLK